LEKYILEIDKKLEFNKKFIKKVTYNHGFIITEIGNIVDIYKMFEQLDKRNSLVTEESKKVKLELDKLEFSGRGSKSKTQSMEITKLLNIKKADNRIIENLNQEITKIRKECEDKLSLMNQELADYDMCKLRIRDLEYKILKWQSNVKNIIDNPIISNTNKLLTYKKNYLTEIMNKLTIEIVNKTTKDEVEIINYQCVKLINKMKKLRDKFIYTNQKNN